MSDMERSQTVETRSDEAHVLLRCDTTHAVRVHETEPTMFCDRTDMSVLQAAASADARPGRLAERANIRCGTPAAGVQVM